MPEETNFYRLRISADLSECSLEHAIKELKRISKGIKGRIRLRASQFDESDFKLFKSKYPRLKVQIDDSLAPNEWYVMDNETLIHSPSF